MNQFTILLIDDVKDNIYTLRLLIEEYFNDINILEALSVEDAILLLMKNNVDLILSDVQMPESSGFDLANYLQDIEETKNIPIILITGIYNDDRYTKEGYNSSPMVVDFISKPIADEILYSKLKVFKQIFEENKFYKKEYLKFDKETTNKIKIKSMINSLQDHFPNLKDDYKEFLAEDENLINIEEVIKKNKK